MGNKHEAKPAYKGRKEKGDTWVYGTVERGWAGLAVFLQKFKLL